MIKTIFLLSSTKNRLNVFYCLSTFGWEERCLFYFVLLLFFKKGVRCMKLIDIYRVNKEKYPKYVIMIKCGNFYEVYGEEVYIINNLFNYKIKDFNGINRVGFPLISYNKVTLKLDKFKINHIVIDDNIYKKRFNKNNYDNYISHLSIDERINNIFNRISILKNTSKINNILESIENII